MGLSMAPLPGLDLHIDWPALPSGVQGQHSLEDGRGLGEVGSPLLVFPSLGLHDQA